MNADDPAKKEAERLIATSRALIEKIDALLAKAAAKSQPGDRNAPKVDDSRPSADA